MFNCDFCKNPSLPREWSKPIVTEWREKTYSAVELPMKFGDPRPRRSRTGKGFESVTVKRACTACVESGKAVEAKRPEKTAVARFVSEDRPRFTPQFNRPSLARR